mmetsp:Transcript_22017/g.56181  ORF Transcript_22017/g.56181 Transcript_22017/m.56181 type:complete len:269 (+) Transcript_22017:412-1218(+)
MICYGCLLACEETLARDARWYEWFTGVYGSIERIISMNCTICVIAKAKARKLSSYASTLVSVTRALTVKSPITSRGRKRAFSAHVDAAKRAPGGCTARTFHGSGSAESIMSSAGASSRGWARMEDITSCGTCTTALAAAVTVERPRVAALPETFWTAITNLSQVLVARRAAVSATRVTKVVNRSTWFTAGVSTAAGAASLALFSSACAAIMTVSSSSMSLSNSGSTSCSSSCKTRMVATRSSLTSMGAATSFGEALRKLGWRGRGGAT